MTTLRSNNLDSAQKDIKQPQHSVPVLREEDIACAETRALYHALNECIGSKGEQLKQE
jgi:hypothetical protein